MSPVGEPIVVEQSFDSSPEVVWNAITVHEQMVKWFFDNIPAFRAEEGFETEFVVDTGEREYHSCWKILEVVPGKKIVYDWRYKDVPGEGKVTFEVAPDGDGTMLRVTNEGIETFPQDIPEFTRESCMEGWNFLLEGSLKQHLGET